VYTYTVFDGGTCEEWWEKPFPGSSKSHTFGIGPYAFGGGYGNAPPVPVHDTSPRNAAISKLAEKAGQEVNNLAQDLVQVNQLTRVVSDTCSRITGAIRALKGRNIPKAVSILWQKKLPQYRRGGGPKPGKSTAENWLEMQYGWKPLLQDVEGAAKSLAYLNSGTLLAQTVRSTKSKTSMQSGSITVAGEGAGSWTVITKTEIRFGMRFNVGEPLSAFLAQIGFNNPISLLWEVIPYSFVIDWFLPIGEFLQGMKHWEGLHFVDGYETRFTRQTAIYDMSYFKEDQYHVDVRNGNYSRDAVLLDRLVLSAFPEMQLPSFKNPVSATHALNALALLRVAFSGGRFFGR
jgi:hypothetical protein